SSRISTKRGCVHVKLATCATPVTGSLKITKTVNAGGSNFTSGTFGFHVDCGNGGVFDPTLTYPTPGSVTITDIPTSSSCTVTERSEERRVGKECRGSSETCLIQAT